MHTQSALIIRSSHPLHPGQVLSIGCEVPCVEDSRVPLLALRSIWVVGRGVNISEVNGAIVPAALDTSHSVMHIMRSRTRHLH
jgi:hypothetical protein